jgi:hypothetical protein
VGMKRQEKRRRRRNEENKYGSVILRLLTRRIYENQNHVKKESLYQAVEAHRLVRRRGSHIF